MYAVHADGTPALREKLMGVELPPIDRVEMVNGFWGGKPSLGYRTYYLVAADRGVALQRPVVAGDSPVRTRIPDGRRLHLEP